MASPNNNKMKPPWKMLGPSLIPQKKDPYTPVPSQTQAGMNITSPSFPGTEAYKLQENIIKQVPGSFEGSKALNVHPGLLKLMPGFSFLLKKALPGIFVLFFPKNNLVYVGKSGNVTKEVSMYLTLQRTNEILNRLVKENNGVLESYSIYQGLGLSDKNFLGKLEEQMILVTSKFNVNKMYNPLVQKPSAEVFENDPFLQPSFIQAEVISGSLAAYNLDWTGEVPPRGEKCIYLYINAKTKNFYIGETNDFYGAAVIKRHINGIRDHCRKISRNEDPLCKSRSAVKNVADDLNIEGNKLLFTCLKKLGTSDKSQRLAEETRFKNEALALYGSRCYNLKNPVSGPGPTEHTNATKNKIRESALGQDITMDTTPYGCVCEGIFYPTRAHASKAYGYKSKDGIKYKLANPNLKNFIDLKNLLGKTIPDDPALQKQIADFYAIRKIRAKVVIKRVSS